MPNPPLCRTAVTASQCALAPERRKPSAPKLSGLALGRRLLRLPMSSGDQWLKACPRRN